MSLEVTYKSAWLIPAPQGEVLGGAILQQSFVVDYVVENNMCMDCNRANANNNSWSSCVQVRRT